MQISMPQVGFEPMILVFEQVETVNASDGAIIVISNYGVTVQ
jgi:hypothetical protein